MKFRKKPVVIEAVQWTGKNFEEIRNFTNGNIHPRSVIDRNEDGEYYLQKYAQLFILTLEGSQLASIGDWIIKGIKGEFYPCKPDIFNLTYEELRE